MLPLQLKLVEGSPTMTQMRLIVVAFRLVWFCGVGLIPMAGVALDSLSSSFCLFDFWFDFSSSVFFTNCLLLLLV